MEIPKRLMFTYRTNILTTKRPSAFYKNVRETIALYRDAWRQPDAPVTFLDDDGCRDVIQSAAPSLLSHFDGEQLGAYRGDICRVAALLRYGGYYFDVDIKCLRPVMLGPCKRFATVLQPNGKY